MAPVVEFDGAEGICTLAEFCFSRQKLGVFSGNKSSCKLRIEKIKWVWNEFGVIKHTWYGVSTQGVLSFALSWLLDSMDTYESAQIKLFSRNLVSTN